MSVEQVLQEAGCAPVQQLQLFAQALLQAINGGVHALQPRICPKRPERIITNQLKWRGRTQGVNSQKLGPGQRPGLLSP